MTTYIDTETPHITDIKRDPHRLTQAGIGGLLLGSGGRIARELLTLGSRPPEKSLAGLKPRRSTVTRMPIEVTEDEAEELRQRGVRVREILRKTATDSIPTVRSHQTGPSSPLGGLALGMTGTAGTLTGWGLTDRVIGYLRRRAVKSDMERVRGRIERVLKDQPDEEDEKVYGIMKGAEDHFFSRPTGEQQQMEKTAFGLADLWWLLPTALGSGAMLQAVSGFQRAGRDSPHRGKVNALKRSLRQQRLPSTAAGLDPFVRLRPAMAPVQEKAILEVEEEEEPAEDFVVVKEAPGSPAQQAAAPTSGWF